MRLKKMKLSGFKSFADNTTVIFPSDLVAIVGPNGCGKSNIIDAVRWVLGEGSAKTLRADAMTAVIFAGSNTRKPVGQASVELVFDNSDGRCGGEYAKYDEISIRRVVTMDGRSDYFLNGTRCRRRDIVGIFLGTGLGPRSYAIIQQGTVSKLIEAKPDELRIYLEEVAGISKYKERRRETETRIKHTRENLERLSDLREELEKQLNHLNRQANAAQRYTELKQAERLLNAQLQSLRLKIIKETIAKHNEVLAKQELALQTFLSKQENINTRSVELREQQIEYQDKFNEVQQKFYQVGGDIARLEQSIEHQQERTEQLQLDQQEVEQTLTQAQYAMKHDSEQLTQLQQQIVELEPRAQATQQQSDETNELLQQLEDATQEAQQQWEEFSQQSAQTTKTAEVEQTRIQNFENNIKQCQQRLQIIDDKLSQIDIEDLDVLATLENQAREIEEQKLEQQQQLDDVIADLKTERGQANLLKQQLNDVLTSQQQLKGKQASLEALQQASLGKGKKAIVDWLTKNNLMNKPRLAETIQVQAGWETAVETVLGNHLQAVSTDDYAEFSQALAQLQQGQVTLFDQKVQTTSATSSDSLLSKISAPLCLQSLLDDILVADDLSQALAMRAQLTPTQTVITKQGVWLARNWIKISKAEDEHSGTLYRKRELEMLAEQLAQNEEQQEILKQHMAQTEEKIATLESNRDLLQQRINELSTQFADYSAQIRVVNERQQHQKRQLQQLEYDKDIQHQQIAQLQKQLEISRSQWQQAMDKMQFDADNREELLQRRDELRISLNQAKSDAHNQRELSHRLALELQSYQNQHKATQQTVERLQLQLSQLQNRKQQITQQLAQSSTPIDDLKHELEEKLEQRVQVEELMSEAKNHLDEAEQQLRHFENERGVVQRDIDNQRQGLEQLKLDHRAAQVQEANIQQTLSDMEFNYEEVLVGMTSDISVDQLSAEIESIQARIQRLGPINLAAIDEYKTHSERKVYLDEQNDDLMSALQTLENAIEKIDRETKNRFKETFDTVNENLQTLFPKLFNGGKAYLELTGDDLLNTGVSIMARPPGKRNSSIHLLSGGEKALVAIALVFSLFQLNPAPFCMLDEVDAPLDDANVGRFSTLVNEMSKHVQVLYITHNKSAMEMAKNLIGVTMKEAGVSRLVSVDVEQAAEMVDE